MALTLDNDREDEGKTDLTPMIDIIFLLLVFLILTTKFVKDEEILRQVLGQQGQATTTVSITPPTTINIAVYPADAPRGADAKSLTDYAAMRGLQRTEPVRLRIGGDEFLLDPNADEEQQLERLHSFVGGVLNRLEVPAAPGMRLDQDPIVIHCYSGMPWRYACWVYDAVRSFEMDQTPGERLAVDANTGSAHERQVSFAPPRVRAYSEFERGRELQEIMTVR